MQDFITAVLHGEGLPFSILCLGAFAHNHSQADPALITSVTPIPHPQATESLQQMKNLILHQVTHSHPRVSNSLHLSAFLVGRINEGEVEMAVVGAEGKGTI